MSDPAGLAGVVAFDGHDGTGKSTIARAVAERLGAAYARPFGGAAGRALMAASDAGDEAAIVRVGEDALAAALDAPRPLVLDRGWVTVATLLPWERFEPLWSRWVPTVVCWCDLETTLERLADRDEPAEALAWHEHYIARYREIAAARGCPLVVTAGASVEHSTEEAYAYVRELLDL